MSVVVHKASAVPPQNPAFSHAIETAPGARLIHISGQIGAREDGSFHDDFEDEAAQAFANLEAVLKSIGLTAHNIVRFTIYLTRREDSDAMRQARNRFMQGHAPAMTLLYVAGLVDPKVHIELEATAAA
ncbi:RidA family protein [Agrobacterium larrymoorei]|uniref:RidA family protein n=1 Tax=Agrobacterium larrymoorei TaxID=160699 RepID=A0AAF0KJJ0_9HYPH|nr:RidA family protein [Agrobacterium larrymoorei]WHA42614.1 RidA family protein [Agrobacterium larrymoorei]